MELRNEISETVFDLTLDFSENPDKKEFVLGREKVKDLVTTFEFMLRTLARYQNGN